MIPTFKLIYCEHKLPFKSLIIIVIAKGPSACSVLLVFSIAFMLETSASCDNKS